MKFVLQPWQLLLIILAGWINRQRQQRIEYLETIVSVLKEHNGKKLSNLTTDRPFVDANAGSCLGRVRTDFLGVTVWDMEPHPQGREN